MSGLQHKNIPRSLTQPLLVAGAERTPAGVVAGIGAGFCGLGWQLHSWVGFCTGVVVFIGGLALLRRIGKADPIMFRVYFRYLRYRPVYPALSRPRRHVSPLKTIRMSLLAGDVVLGVLWHLTRSPFFEVLAEVSILGTCLAFLPAILPERP